LLGTMKIAFIRYKYDPFGGAERFTQALVERLAARGVEIHLYARKWVAQPSASIVFHRVGGPRWPAILGYAGFVFLVGRAVRGMDFDLVLSNERTLCQDIYRAGDGVHARWLELRSLRMGRLRRLSLRCNPFHAFRLWLERRLFEAPDLKAVIVNSDMVRREILARFELDAQRIFTIYNGVDLKRFCPSLRATAGTELRMNSGVRDDEMILLFVGSGFERKGLEFVIRGLARSKTPARLWVVGKGRKAGDERLARELNVGDRVEFWGPRKDTAPFYAAADAFVLPTLYDPFPSVILEAMASGLPVITTAQCGAAEILTQGIDGYVLEKAWDSNRMAEYLDCLGSPEERRRMGGEARKRAEDFPWERTLNEMEELYERLISEAVRQAR
jgi:UDP-glucose:(heptosyl)LPS alpha-1,3-glucosyltransferase